MDEMTLEEYQEMYMNNPPAKGKKTGRGSSYNGRRSQARGKGGENIVETVLNNLGLVLVEKINVGWTVIWPKDGGKGQPKVFPQKKVSGDFRAVTTKGQSVLVEVKTYNAPRLPFSVLRPHQVKSLNIHANVGGLSLLVWVNSGRVIPIWWPIEGFEKGHSLTEEMALENEWKGEV